VAAAAENLATLTLRRQTRHAIGLALTGVRVDQLDDPNEHSSRGHVGILGFRSSYSMHLLVVLIVRGYMGHAERFGRVGWPWRKQSFPRRGWR